MVDGGVSIAVRSVYLGKQVRSLLFEVLQETEKPAGKMVRQAQSFVDMSSNRTIEKRVNDVDISRGSRAEAPWLE